MSDLFLGQLLLVPYNFAPKGWAFANGQIMSISQNTALFSLLGTYFGGNGTSTFGLPDLRGRIPIGSGQGGGLSDYSLGEPGGVEMVTLLGNELPMHTHTLESFAGPGSTNVAAANSIARGGMPYSNAAVNQNLSQFAVRPAGGSQAHENRMPYLTMNWIIALQGVFPARG